MTFEEWWNKYLFLGDELDKELAEAAWEAAFDEGLKWALKQNANTLNKLQITLEPDDESN